MSDYYPIAVLGAGPAGSNYIRELKKVWDINLVGFTNRSEARRQEVATETELPGYANLTELLEQSSIRPKMVVIATANPTHEAFAIEAMEAGLDVFCEKPMAMTLDGCERMMKVEQKTGRKLQIGFEYRYGSMTARLKELQELAHFGELTCIDITDSRGHWWPDDPDTEVSKVWRLNKDIGGGPILHCGIHELDLMRYYAGDVAELQAFVPQRSLQYYPAHAPDHVNLQVRFQSGATGSFTLYHNIAGTWYRAVPPHHPNYHQVPGHGLDIIITGTKGSAIAEIYAEQLHVNSFDTANHETLFLRTETFNHQNPNVSHHNTTGMIVDFARNLRDGKGVIHSTEDSYRTTIFGMKAEEAIQEAIEDGWSSQRYAL